MENFRRLKPRINRVKLMRQPKRISGGICARTIRTRPFSRASAPVIPPQLLRKQLGMTQDEFARALRIPLSTLRNWEQGRVLPDPAARSLLTIVAKNPKAALKALAA